MKFRVTRTSLYNEDTPPCEGAVKDTYTEHRYCTLPLAEAMTSQRTEWFRNLTNHRSAPGGSVADSLDEPCWFIEVADMDDLLAFIDRHGSVVVQNQSDGPAIEIYDGYRE